MKYGIIFDSTCGKNKKEVEKDNNFFIPIIINFNKKKYKSGIDIDNEFLFKNMDRKNNINLKTSSPEQKDIIETFREGLKKHKELIYIGLSSKFSGTLNSARIVSESFEEFKGKIHIYDSEFSAPWTKIFYDDICKIIRQNENIEDIYELLDFQKGKMIGYISPGDIYWFYKGGRISLKSYLIGSLARINPILIVKNGEFLKDKVYKPRGINRAIEKILELLEIQKKEFEEKKFKISFCVFKSNLKEEFNISKEAIIKKFNLKKEDLIEAFLSPEQTSHLGPGSIGFAIIANYEKFKK